MAPVKQTKPAKNKTAKNNKKSKAKSNKKRGLRPRPRKEQIHKRKIKTPLFSCMLIGALIADK